MRSYQEQLKSNAELERLYTQKDISKTQPYVANSTEIYDRWKFNQNLQPALQYWIPRYKKYEAELEKYIDELKNRIGTA